MLRMQVILLLLFLGATTQVVVAQEEDDLLALLGEPTPTVDYAYAAFKTNRVINFHSLESTAAGVLDFKISHRFGMLNQGAYDLFGLDNASIRIGADYGLSDRLTVGFGRSSYQKTYDGFVKMKLLRQSNGKRMMPITLALFASTAVQTLRWQNPDRVNYFSSRLYHSFQLILGRKISDVFSLQFSPTLVHRNLVRSATEENDVLALGSAGRIRLSRRAALNVEYMYVLPDQLAPGYRNALSVGFDIETGGHVFQLHLTNSTAMIEKGFVTENSGNWADGGIHFGFNVSRVFTVKRKGE